MKARLSIFYFLQFAVFGTFLTTMGLYLSHHGMGDRIGWFYSIQGAVSLFMPALVGVVADRWVAPRKLHALCHALCAVFMLSTCVYAVAAGSGVAFAPLFALYTLGILFYMPTLALSFSVGYAQMAHAGLDVEKDYPAIRMWGTVGFVCSMWVTDLAHFAATPLQFGFCGVVGLVAAAYTLSLPFCPMPARGKRSFAQALGADAFVLFRQPCLVLFFLICMLGGACLQISNGYATPYIASFAQVGEYANTFAVAHPNILVSLSQISETLCLLAIPFFMRRFGIRGILVIAFCAWAARFLFLALGNPGGGLWLLALSMLAYGFAFDFFAVSSSMFINSQAPAQMRNAAQGLFQMCNNGIGSAIGMLFAQNVVNHYVDHTTGSLAGWESAWLVFAAYSACLILFVLLFFHPAKTSSPAESSPAESSPAETSTPSKTPTQS